MFSKLDSKRGGFTLMEVMIVVAIIALLAVIAVPNVLRSRKRSQATQVLEDLRLIDSAVDQYAIENNRKQGDTVAWATVRNYLKTGSRLESSGGTDIIGSSFGGTFTVETVPVVPSATFNALSDVAPSTFWEPYLASDSPSDLLSDPPPNERIRRTRRSGRNGQGVAWGLDPEHSGLGGPGPQNPGNP